MSISDILSQMLSTARESRHRPHRIPLGLVLLSRGLIDQEKLQEALRAQRESGTGRLGEWLQRLGLVGENQITAALSIQWSSPVFPLENHPRFLECAGLVPLPILEASRMVVVHYRPTTGSLCVAFADGIDHTALRALEGMFECRAVASIASESSLKKALKDIRSLARPPEITIDCNGHSAKEIAHTMLEYVVRNSTEEVRLANCHDYIWARLENPAHRTNLLFRVSPSFIKHSPVPALPKL